MFSCFLLLALSSTNRKSRAKKAAPQGSRPSPYHYCTTRCCTRIHSCVIKGSSVALRRQIQGVLGQFHHQILVRQSGLAAETGFRPSPHALSSMSSSSSSLGSRESKPSRTTQWQVVQAQDFSQACSISMPLRSAMSRMVSPVAPSRAAPSGQSSGWGRIISLAYYTLLTFCPVSTLRMEASIRRAANSPLAASAASMASLIWLVVPELRMVSRWAMAASSSARSAGSIKPRHRRPARR